MSADITPTTTNRPHHTDLTTFKMDLLVACGRLEGALGEVHGLAIKQYLEEIYEQEINHGRLYPNLDDLADEGLIQKRKRAIDDRTNSYELTTDGFETILERQEHLQLGVFR